MARDHGRILASIWSDPDFMDMSQEPQRLYLFLITQPNLSAAGVLPVTARRWAASASDLSAAMVNDLLDELADRRFVVWDQSTEEVMVRTYLRHDKIYRQPNVMLKAVNDASEIVSARIRLALLRELDRLPLEEVSDAPTAKGGPSARQVVTDCIETLRRTLFAVDDRRTATPSETLSGRVPETLSGTGSGSSGARINVTDSVDHRYSPLAQNEDQNQHHNAAVDPFDPAVDPAHSSPGLWEDAQVSGLDGTPPEWVAETLPGTPHAHARAHHARFPYPLGPSPNPENLCSPEVSAEAPKRIKPTPKQSDFEAFWKSWPRRVGKIKAEAAFVAAVKKGADPAAIIAACVSYAERQQRAGTPKDKIPHPTTWLNRGSWDDDLDDAVPLPAAPVPTMQPPAYGQPAARPAASCDWCDGGLYERTDGRMARCEHTDQPPAGHPAAELTRSTM